MADTSAKDFQMSFLTWLQSPNTWKWCAIVGHSLGGGMATISAGELAMLTGKRYERVTLLQGPFLLKMDPKGP